MTVSVIGSDGRRILRGVDAQYAKEFAARITADTGEKLELVDDDDGLVASGIRQQPFAGVDDPEAAVVSEPGETKLQSGTTVTTAPTVDWAGTAPEPAPELDLIGHVRDEPEPEPKAKAKATAPKRRRRTP